MRFALLFVGVMLSALALRVLRLDMQPLWWDEGYSVFFATRDFSTMLARTAVDIHPPLYYALLQLWITLAGNSELVLRLLSVLIGIATVPFMYLLGSRSFGRRVGVLSAILLAISPLSIYYSQEVRMYGLVTLLAAVSMFSQFVLLDKYHTSLIPSLPPGAGGQRKPPLSKRNGVGPRMAWRNALEWAMYIISSAAALYAEYYAAFAVAAEIIVVLYWWRRRRARFSHWLLAWVTVVILYLPWAIYAAPKLYAYVTAKVGIEQYSTLDPLSFLAQHLAAFSVGHLSGFHLLAWGSVIFVGLAGFGIMQTRRLRAGPGGVRVSKAPGSREMSIATISIYVVAPLVCGWLLNVLYSFHPVRYERLLLFASAPFYVLVALGLAALLDQRTRWAFAAIALIMTLSAVSLADFYTVPRYPDEDYRPLIAEMAAESSSGDVVLAPYPWQIGYLESYFPDSRINVVEVPSDAWISNPDVMDSSLNSIRSISTRTWLLAYQTKGRILEDEIANFYAEAYRLTDNWYGNTRLEYFERVADPPVNENQIVFGPDLKLDSFGVASSPIIRGKDFVLLRLHWVSTSNNYSYSLRLIDRSGEKRVQQDEPIATGNVVERLGMFVPRDTPPGDFDLILVVYLRTDATPLALPDGSKEFTLAHLTVNAQ